MSRCSLLAALLAACAASGPASGHRSRAPAPGGVKPLEGGWLAEVEFPEYLERPSPAREAEIARAVHHLDDREFSTWSGAARRLVSVGEQAVPYLGYVAEVQSPAEGSDPQATIALRAILRKIPSERVALHMASPYRAVRVAAANVAGEGDMACHAVRLAEMLDDPDLDVRRAAILALRQLSNRYFGYRADAPPEERMEAAARWRELWASG